MYLRVSALPSGPYGRGPRLCLLSAKYSPGWASQLCVFARDALISAPESSRFDNMENRSERRKTSENMGQGGRFQVPLTTHKQPQRWALSKRRNSTQTARARQVCESAWIGSEESEEKAPLCVLFGHCFAFVGFQGAPWNSCSFRIGCPGSGSSWSILLRCARSTLKTFQRSRGWRSHSGTSRSLRWIWTQLI